MAFAAIESVYRDDVLVHRVRPGVDVPIGTDSAPERVQRRVSAIAVGAAILVTMAGAAVLVGWMFDVHRLKTIHGPITMKANASLALLLCGVSLMRLLRRAGPLGLRAPC